MINKKLSQDKLRRLGRLCFDLVMSIFVMVFKFKLDFADRLHSNYIQIKITDQKNLLFGVNESYSKHMKVTPVDGIDQIFDNYRSLSFQNL